MSSLERKVKAGVARARYKRLWWGELALSFDFSPDVNGAWDVEQEPLGHIFCRLKKPNI